ncbi:MAG: alcohol dehydrogenase catalytic domain-containing protein [Propionibacteriaceae bacterium]|nr:alcohol dehydrogenase catalytic domain-containing protein [Micropruina sp.]HBX81072.1 Zn-dependent alcohol dehydrogenase [Propionibacteriaceae bacterium]HBY24710.1 Zn-dependent alcohol dehydrogenase [Propionibacteriaceae bacterium]
MMVASYLGAGQLAVDTTPAVPPAPGEVQLRVAFVGICGTDLHILHGAMDERIALPQAIGHEVSATVAALGEGVTGWAVGDRVTVMPLDWDGTCPACLAGHRHLCHHLNFVGIDSPGGLQEYWNVGVSLLVALPPSLGLREAALAEPTAVAVHDVRRSGLATGDKAVVLGGGPIGVLIAAVARHLGALVMVSEVDAERRRLAASLGFAVVDPTDEALGARVEDWTRGAGADVVFEVSGAGAAVAQATSLLKVRGVLVVVAIHSQPQAVDLKRVFWRELTLLGTRVYEREDFARALDLLAHGVIPAAALISAVEPLRSVPEAFERLQGGGAMKILIAVGGDST